MNGQKAVNPVLLFVYLICFYISIGFPWNSQSGAIFGLHIGGFVLEPHLLLILLVLLPLYIFSGSTVQSGAIRRVLFICKTISITSMIYFFISVFILSSKYSIFESLTLPMLDLKTWFLFWMMPVTVLYIYDRGIYRWLRHFFIATACYCVLSIIVLRTPHGWGANFISIDSINLYGRITMENDLILVLAIPLAIAMLQDRGGGTFLFVCLALFILKLAMGQARTLIAVSGVFTILVIICSGRWVRSFLTLVIIVLGVLLTILTLPEKQKFGIVSRFTNLGTQAEKYVAMLIQSNKIALEQIHGGKLFFGAGFGTPLDLYGGADTKKTVRRYVDNLWVTLLFKVGLVGFLLIGGPILWFCFSAFRGKPLSNVDRTFKFWIFLIPFLSLRGSFLLFNNTVAGVTWSTLAVAVMMAEERCLAKQKPLITSEYSQDEYFPEEHYQDDYCLDEHTPNEFITT
jgi:hypothetical protein